MVHMVEEQYVSSYILMRHTRVYCICAHAYMHMHYMYILVWIVLSGTVHSFLFKV